MKVHLRKQFDMFESTCHKRFLLQQKLQPYQQKWQNIRMSFTVKHMSYDSEYIDRWEHIIILGKMTCKHLMLVILDFS